MMTLVAFLSLLPSLVSGHAFIFYPPMRGGASGNSANGFCPHCLGSVDLPMPSCGTSQFLSWDQGPVTTLEAGSKVQFEIRVTAHHKGHFVFRLCDQSISPSTGGLDAEEACFNQHVLQRVRPTEMYADCQPNDSRGDCQPYDDANPGHWYLPPADAGDAVLMQANATSSVETTANSVVAAGATYKFHYWMPAGFSCDKCTLQWWWMSSNSGTPDPDAYRCYFQKIERLGWDANKWCSGACSYAGDCPATQSGYVNVGEQFKNCADVKVVDSGATGGGGGDGTSPTPPPPAPTPSSPTPTPVTEALPCTGTGSCKDLCASACSSNLQRNQCWGTPRYIECMCNDGSTFSFPGCECQHSDCSNGGVTQTPAPTVVSPGQPPTSEPEPEPESEPEAEPEAEPEPESEPKGEPESAQCAAAPGLNRGVSSTQCAQCVDGYQWWPCNEEILCVCSSGCNWDMYWKCGPALEQLRSVRHLRTAKAHTTGSAFIQQALNSTLTSSLQDEVMNDEL